ncbi:hypothetical protein ACVWZK_009091 [Bradyrhizobium sp. GM0.4]
MAGSLQDYKIAILATDGFEYVELVKPRKALDGRRWRPDQPHFAEDGSRSRLELHRLGR